MERARGVGFCPQAKRASRQPTRQCACRAEPGYTRLPAAEPLLRRSIPALIVIFLLVVGGVRFLSLVNWHDDIERNAKTLLSLSAGEMANGLELLSEHAEPGTEVARSLIGRTANHGLGGRYALAVMDGDFRILAASPDMLRWEGKRLDELVSSGQPLFMFGERAGVWRSSSTAPPGTRPSTSTTSAPARSPHWCRSRTCSTTGGARFRSTSRCSCSPPRSCWSSSTPILRSRRGRSRPTASISRRTSASILRWRAAAAGCGTGTWCAARCTGRARCTTCWATRRPTACSRSARSPRSSTTTTATCSTSPTRSCRATST